MFGGMPGYIRNMKRPPVVDEQPLPPIPSLAGQAPPKLNADFDSLMTQLGGQAPAQPPRMANAAPQGLMAQGKPAHQSGPSKGLLGSETFQKPDMTLSDKMGLISGMLMDYDGTMGSGNADRARGMYEQRVGEAQGTFEEQRQRKLMEAAAGGDMNAMFMLDPSLALGERRDRRDFRYGVGRDAKADEQFERGWKRDEGRYETEQERFARLDALEAELGRGNLGVSRMNAETSRMGVNNDAAAAAAGPKINVDDEASFRREYNSITSGFRDVQSSYGRIKATDATTPAGQLSLVYQYMKMLDPGSTVMQGEQASASNAAGVPTRVQNLYNALREGTPLAPEQVTDFINQADLLYERSLQDYDKARTTYEGLATLYGFPPERTVPDFATGRKAPAVGSDGVPNMLRAPERKVGPSGQFAPEGFEPVD
jgi:hypothetical protein